VYNGERYLALALDSLLAQTFEDFELIISDNASSDRSEEIGRCYAARDSRVRYVRNERNLGCNTNFRRAFQLSSGQYFRWAAADDLSDRSSLARCVEILDREPSVVLVYPKTKFIGVRGEVVSEYDDRLHLQSPRASERLEQLLDRLVFCNAHYGLIRASALRRARGLGDYIAADVVLYAELTLYGTFWEIPEFLFYRRLHPEASSSMDDEQRRTFYHPDSPRRIDLTQWRHLWELIRAVERAPLDVGERMRLRLFLARRASWRRKELVREIGAALRQALLGPVDRVIGKRGGGTPVPPAGVASRPPMSVK
jgi:glycosyltransferase involved in cell wall biosynthesis